MNESEFLDFIRELESELFSSRFNRWVRAQPDKDKKAIRELRTEVSIRRSELETNRLKVLADQLDARARELETGMKGLLTEIDRMADFAGVVELLSRIAGAISGIVTQCA